MPIIDSYSDAGIAVVVFDGDKVAARSNSDAKRADKHDSVRKFENARVGMLFIVLMAVVNLFFMFFVWFQPLLWTTPTIMWLTYLWVPELIGDIIALLFVAGYIVLYFMSQKRRKLMTLTLAIVLFETIVLWVYAGIYGISSFTGYSFWYGALVFSLPVIFIVFLAMGAKQVKNLKDVDFHQYRDALEKIDEEAQPDDDNDSMFGGIGVGRRHFRGFRGYGGSGLGGYRGSGGGYGGGFGGGFGG